MTEIATSAGLDGDAAREVLDSGSHAAETRQRLNFWTQNGITGVPTMVFAGKYLMTGAQGPETYAEVLRRCAAEAA